MKTVYYKEYAESLSHWQYLCGAMAVLLKTFRGLVRTPPYMLGGLFAAELSEADFYITRAIRSLEIAESHLSDLRENAHAVHKKREHDILNNKEYNEYQKSHRKGNQIADEAIYTVEIQSDGQWLRLGINSFKTYDNAVQFAKEHNLKKYRILKEQRILTVESISSRIDPEGL